jgi:hypothetical protein
VLSPANTADAAEELLTIAGFLERDAVPPGLGHLELKMAAGAIGYSDIEQMKDDVASLEWAFVRWKERNGLMEANRHLAHLQYLALRDARLAEKSECRADFPYGAAKLCRIRDLARQTWLAEKNRLFGCRPEHLVGAAGLLSEECKISWSGCSTRGTRDGDTA